MGASILVVGLDEVLAAELRRALADLGHTVAVEGFRSAVDCLAAIARAGAELVFCGTDPRQYGALLQSLQRGSQDTPVVVVSRLPETGDWLDAMEAGAWDYCAAPFEPDLIGRIVENTLKCPRTLPLAS